jgi:hypothetical protein
MDHMLLTGRFSDGVREFFVERRFYADIVQPTLHP